MEDETLFNLCNIFKYPSELIFINLENTQTNLVFFDIDKMLGDGVSLCRKLWENGVLAESLDLQKIRFVTHLNVTVTEIEKAIQITADVCKNASM